MTEYTAEETAAHRKAWVDALRSGDYKQTAGKLHRPEGNDDSYCCLGVACELAVKAGVIPPRDELGFYGEGAGRSSLNLPWLVQNWLGVVNGEGRLKETVKDGDLGLHAAYLTSVNDNLMWSFEQIADLIDQGKVETR